MSKSERNDEETMTSYQTIDALMITLMCCIYGIGVFLHTKVIQVCKREKGTCWKLHIFDSCYKMFHYAILILMSCLINTITDLHHYTGKWLCYTYKAFNMYGNSSILGHSFVISAMKYTIIVYSLKVRAIGKEKYKQYFSG